MGNGLAYIRRCLWSVVLVAAGAARILAADAPSTQPWEVAEVRSLRSQVTQLQEQVAALKTENVDLRGRLTAAGINPEDGQGTSDATEAKPKRVVLAVDYWWPGGKADEEAARVISQLDPDQWFNVVTSRLAVGHLVAQPAFGAMQHATPMYRDKAVAYLKGTAGRYSGERTTLLGALKFRPEVIVYVGGCPDDETIAEFVKENRGISAKVYTTTMNAGSDPKVLHRLWQLAHDTKGRCVDADGQPVDEPGLPIVVPPPAKPAPATKASVFKTK